MTFQFSASTLYEFLISSVLLTSPLMTQPQEKNVNFYLMYGAFDAEKFSV